MSIYQSGVDVWRWQHDLGDTYCGFSSEAGDSGCHSLGGRLGGTFCPGWSCHTDVAKAPARDALRERYARGEIESQTCERMRHELKR